jgi:hypothetical protein
VNAYGWIYGDEDHGARALHRGGFRPIPISRPKETGNKYKDRTRKGVPPRGCTGYRGTVTTEKILEWCREYPDRNVAIRHEGTCAIDVDDYLDDSGNLKSGAGELAAFAAKHNLPPLPATWSSTARGPDTPARQHLYRIPDDLQLITKLGKSIEVCQRHHRYTICAPSEHPAHGTPYRWYCPGRPGLPPEPGPVAEPTPVLNATPTKDALSWLPKQWAAALAVRPKAAAGDIGVDGVGVDGVRDAPALLASFASGPMDGRVATAYMKATAPEAHPGHDETLRQLYAAMRLGMEGHRGVPELIEALVARHRHYLTTVGRAESEADSLLFYCACYAQQRPVDPTSVVAPLEPLR